jgi:hypothetical protein
MKDNASMGLRRSPEPVTHKGAVISECETYRYSLTRRWGSPHESRVLFVMLNPSKADAYEDDPTIRRCIAYAQAWGHGSLEVVNLFALRSTNPLGLLEVADPVGPENDSYIRSAATYARTVVLAHGSHGKERLRQSIRARAWTVHAIVKERGHELLCLARTKDRMPKHPLRLRGDLLPVPLAGAAPQAPPSSADSPREAEGQKK